MIKPAVSLSVTTEAPVPEERKEPVAANFVLSAHRNV